MLFILRKVPDGVCDGKNERPTCSRGPTPPPKVLADRTEPHCRRTGHSGNPERGLRFCTQTTGPNGKASSAKLQQKIQLPLQHSLAWGTDFFDNKTAPHSLYGSILWEFVEGLILKRWRAAGSKTVEMVLLAVGLPTRLIGPRERHKREDSIVQSVDSQLELQERNDIGNHIAWL